eukprot:CAMPEP_0117668528 /NCGR_PEP_ID=MMETSP0804-20121206/11602_1 /TAXON_ID=1074897 /ORGANISM="Tetraselmis astigmatica, Strain CCMP880" /LENGTH=165 /DNA_ID=CAMNT_0005476435 /DNA_START=163 /DNA_END=661 /DNA_ORIENTATION=-
MALPRALSFPIPAASATMQATVAPQPGSQKLLLLRRRRRRKAPAQPCSKLQPPLLDMTRAPHSRPPQQASPPCSSTSSQAPKAAMAAVAFLALSTLLATLPRCLPFFRGFPTAPALHSSGCGLAVVLLAMFFRSMRAWQSCQHPLKPNVGQHSGQPSLPPSLGWQ